MGLTVQLPKGYVFPLSFNLSVPRPAPVPANAYQSRAALLLTTASALMPRIWRKPLGNQVTTDYLPPFALGLVAQLPGPTQVVPNPYQAQVW